MRRFQNTDRAPDGNARGRQVAHLTGRLGEPNHAAGWPGIVTDVRIDWVRNRVAAFARADRIPLGLGDLAIVAAAGNSCRAAVLLRTVHPVRETVIRGYSVEFPGLLVVPGAPGVAAVHGNDGALVDAQHNSL